MGIMQKTSSGLVPIVVAGELAAQKGRPGGVAELNSESKLLPVNLPDYLTESGLNNTIAAEATARYEVIDPVADYGADPSGATSSAAAWEAVIAAANAAGGNVMVRCPAGATFDIKAGLTTAITTNYVWITGDGPGAVNFLVQNGTAFKWGDGGTSSVIGGGLSGVGFVGQSVVSTQRCIHIDGASSQKFRRIFIDKIAQLARLGEPTGSGGQCSAPSFRHIYGNGTPFDVALIEAVRGFSLSMSDVVVNADGVGYPTGRTDLHPATSGHTFLRFGAGSWDTAHLSEVTTNRFDYGLDINAGAGAVVSNMWLYGCVFDYGKTRGVRLRVAGVGAYIGSIVFNGGWAVATDAYSVEVIQTASGGLIEHVDFIGFSAQQAGKCNWRFEASANFTGIRLLNCRSHSGNRLSGNALLDTADVLINADGVSIVGGRFGDEVPGGAWQPAYGVIFYADTAVQITGVTATSAGTDWYFDNYTTADTRALVTGNFVDDAAGRPNYATIGAITAPASAAVQTHKNPTVDTLHIYGGTVTSITHRGVQVGTAGPATIELRPGDTWSVTYSAAPTIVRSVQP